MLCLRTALHMMIRFLSSSCHAAKIFRTAGNAHYCYNKMNNCCDTEQLTITEFPLKRFIKPHTGYINTNVSLSPLCEELSWPLVTTFRLALRQISIHNSQQPSYIN